MIRLSIVIPSRSHDLTSVSRILQACSWIGPRVEVVVRDSSGSAAKAAFLRDLERDNYRLIVAPPGEEEPDCSEALAAARGDFVCLLDEDDIYLDRAMAMLPGVIETVAADPAVVGVAAPILIEMQQGAEGFAYPNIDAGDPLVRLSGYLSADRPNVLLFSPIRRSTMIAALETIRSRPLAMPFDDRLASLLYLLAGRFARMTRLLCAYDATGADNAGRADALLYQRAHLDAATNKLQWFLCGFEGATLIRHAALPTAYSPQQRQAMADLWFSAMFARFKAQPRDAGSSPLTGEAEKLCVRWKESGGRLAFADMLADICQFMALSSQENALKYFAFWSELLGLHQAGAA